MNTHENRLQEEKRKPSNPAPPKPQSERHRQSKEELEGRKIETEFLLESAYIDMAVHSMY
jgi:hypothetical protein